MKKILAVALVLAASPAPAADPNLVTSWGALSPRGLATLCTGKVAAERAYCDGFIAAMAQSSNAANIYMQAAFGHPKFKLMAACPPAGADVRNSTLIKLYLSYWDAHQGEEDMQQNLDASDAVTKALQDKWPCP